MLEKLKTYGIITFGTLVCALGINLFFVPADIVAGGVSGIGIIVHSLTGFPMGIFMLALNLPLFLLGLKFLGGSFGIKTLYGTVVLSVFIDLTNGLFVITKNPLLCALFGGAVAGIGMGIVFLSGASSGGTDVLARLGYRALPAIDVGKWLFIIDFIIIAAGAIAFNNYELSLYGIIALFINTYMIDFLIDGANFAKIVYIISPEYEKIANEITTKANRGVTGIYARGVYTKSDVLMLMCVVKNFELARLKALVQEIDKNAFIILTQAHEVAGEGFKKYPI